MRGAEPSGGVAKLALLVPAAVLGVGLHGVVAQAAPAVVVHLEVARRLGEAVAVVDVVQQVVPVEQVGDRRRLW